MIQNELTDAPSWVMDIKPGRVIIAVDISDRPDLRDSVVIKRCLVEYVIGLERCEHIDYEIRGDTLVLVATGDLTILYTN